MLYTMRRTLEVAYEKLLEILKDESIMQLLRYTPEGKGGDIAFPCFPFAKKQGVNPALFANELAAKLQFTPDELLLKAEATGGYLNFYINYRVFCQDILSQFKEKGSEYGELDFGAGKTVVIDYSSPNIAKPFSIGHLRSTDIGAALKEILKFVGYTVIGDNHIGDWGTQFGKLISAYKRWGDDEEIKKSPIRAFLALYVRFHSEAEELSKSLKEGEINPLEEEGRAYFKKLEDGDPEITALWSQIRNLSLAEFQKVYDMLGVSFEEILGEYFYNDKMDEIINLAQEKGLTEQDAEGTLLVRLDKYGIDTPLLLKKRDGASLYATRDLACIRYRTQRWNPDKILYVVGEEQQLYFKQLFKIKELLGIETDCEHIAFGLISLNEGKISTRKGNVIFLEDVLKESWNRTAAFLEDRGFTPEEKEKIIHTVGTGALKYQDLSQNRKKNVVFNWDKMLSLDGNSAAYLQYGYSRARSILRKGAYSADLDWNPDVELTPSELSLIKKLAKFPEVVQSAAEQFYPHIIAVYLFELTQEFTSFYTDVKVLGEPQEIMQNRLLLTDFYSSVMQRGLALLGIGVVEAM